MEPRFDVNVCDKVQSLTRADIDYLIDMKRKIILMHEKEIADLTSALPKGECVHQWEYISGHVCADICVKCGNRKPQ